MHFASAAHTTKPPLHCPTCSSRKIIRKGVRRKKLETVQLWRCTICKRVFTPAPGALRNKTYPLPVILRGMELYNLGYPLSQVVTKLKSRFGYSISNSTINNWIHEHEELMSYHRLRKEAIRAFRPTTTIKSVKLYHRQVYEFAYHQPKLLFTRSSMQHGKFAGLADFIESVPTICPHELFGESARASQLDAGFINPSRLIVTPKENFATRTAEFVLPTIGNNYLRHGTLQRFMLVNDSVTVAVEIPIWLKPSDIAEIEAEYSTRLLAQGAEGASITGHIDFIQVRHDKVHILDYKPDAKTNRPVAQLTIYALAISRLAGIPLFDIKCAWFNEEQYCEFFPGALLPRR